MMDSVTRFARGLREIGLAAGEPPTRKGYPASTLAVLPKLLERAGPAEKGSITGFYTVLVEGDDMNEPVADEVRSLIDGHIILSRRLASANHYPAIDVLESRSRIMDMVVTPAHNAAAGRLRGLMAKYKELELLLQMGEYRAGADAEADAAVKKRDQIDRFLRQSLAERAEFEPTIKAMLEIAQK
jgi:type III secretion protein N (ATPase)